MYPPNGTFIYLLGIAGCGKLTIAKAIQRRHSCIIVDNHHINNVIFALVDPDGITPLVPAVWEKVSRVRLAVLETVRDLGKPGRTFIFTNELLEGVPRHNEVFEDLRRTSAERGARLCTIRLQIDPEEAARRATCPGRAEAFKEIDPNEARRKAREAIVLRPQGLVTLNLDVTHLTPDQAAERILAHVHATEAFQETRRGP
jgi:ribose 1,5-bisphosphokinase PhnN